MSVFAVWDTNPIADGRTKGNTSRVQSKSSLRPDEVTMFMELIDYHERSSIVGRLDDEFAVAFSGNEGDLTHPGIGHSRPVSMRTLRRFEKLGLIEILSQTDAAMTFGMADDFRQRWSSFISPVATMPAVFISVAEVQKEKLARPFRGLLAASGVQGFIVSDEPLLENTWTPEQKVEAYLDRSNAVVVFAMGDLAAEGNTYTRPNIADEIARARSRPGLRDRVCVLREHGVKLPSNINPAYEGLDPDSPEPAFRRALQQLAGWGLPVSVQAEPPARPADSKRSSGRRHPAEDQADTSVDHRELIERAIGRIPSLMNTAGEPSLALTMAGGPRQPVLRPAELEDPKLANQLTRELLFGDAALFEPSEGTTSAMSGNSLIISRPEAGWRSTPRAWSLCSGRCGAAPKRAACRRSSTRTCAPILKVPFDSSIACSASSMPAEESLTLHRSSRLSVLAMAPGGLAPSRRPTRTP